MQINKDEKWAAWLRREMLAYVRQDEKADDGKWHVHHLIFPRFSVLDILSGRKPTDEEIGYFVTGIAYHRFLQGVLGKRGSEKSMEYLGVVGTADFIGPKTGASPRAVLVEIKTSRKWTLADQPEPHYVDTLGYYCVTHGRTGGKIIVIYPTAGRKWDGSKSSTVEFVVWNVQFTPVELQGIRLKMDWLSKELTRAVKTGNISRLPRCPEWKCKKCPYKEKCGVTVAVKAQKEKT